MVTDHDSKVLARKTFRCRAWELGVALDWAAGRAAAKGWAGVTVACEPTGHRWRVLGLLAADRGMPFVCVQPMVTSWARRAEGLTFDKTDDKDAVLIARLTAQRRCYVPESDRPAEPERRLRAYRQSQRRSAGYGFSARTPPSWTSASTRPAIALKTHTGMITDSLWRHVEDVIRPADR